jgi:hypothetical protein
MDFVKRGDYWLDTLPDGKLFIKYSSGVSFLEAPFFFLAWTISLLFKVPVNGGYNPVFFECIHYGVFLYFLLGLHCLRKVLLHFNFSEIVTSITLLCVFFGTNTFHYILGQGLMSHGFLFSLHSIFLYLTIRFYNNPNVKNSVLIGFVGGLIALIRPTEVLCFMVFVLWEVNSIQIFKERVLFFLRKYYLVMVMLLIFIVVWVPQMLYWKHISGGFLLYSYKDEKLLFDSPKLLEILFSPRTGLIPYCPIVILFFISLFIPKTVHKGKFGIALFVIINIYLVSCWWCWWYGGSFGSRALVQIFPYLAISFAGMLQLAYTYKAKAYKFIKYSLSVVVFLAVLLHLKFWYQSKNGYVHYDSMSRKAYWFIFPRILLNGEETATFYSLLTSPSYDPKDRDTVK